MLHRSTSRHWTGWKGWNAKPVDPEAAQLIDGWLGTIEVISHTIHGTGIFTYIYLTFMVNVGTVNIPYMDGMGMCDKMMKHLLM